MRRLAFLFLVFAVPTFAQRTIVSGTVKDVNGLPYSGASLTITLSLPTGSLGAYLNGAQIAGTVGPLTLDTTGSFIANLADNTLVQCANAQGQLVTCVPQTQWTFRVTLSPGIAPPLGTGPQTCNATLTISGTSQNVSGSFLSCPALSGAPAGSFSGTSDPPVTQSFTATTTGAQGAIDLRQAPIDTHTISWRLNPGTLTPLVDSVPYANGDLHTANVNWVYQTGTFNVNANAIFGSAASSLAYRSDGANTANEFAQATVIETVASAAQNHGPCVRVQTGSLTAYCLQLAIDSFRIIYLNAGVITTLYSFDTSVFPLTGDVLKIQAVGNLLSGFRNGVLLGSVTDPNIASGLTGLVSFGNANSNGVSNFQSAALPACTVALDSSPDGATWTAGGIIPGQFCGASSGSFTATQAIANFVRVNVTALSAGQTLTVVYSGRLAGAPPSGNNSVSNGMWVQPGEVVWIQYSSVASAGPFVAHQSVRIANGSSPASVTTTTWDVLNCLSGPGGGAGTGFIVTQPGWLLSVTADVNTVGFAQGTFAVNQYILRSMPAGGGTASCATGLTVTQIGAILGTWPTGSFYPVGFVGTTGQYVNAWSIPGLTTVLSPSNPAAGADWTTITTVNGRTCVQSVTFQLVTSAAAANRLPVLVFKLVNFSGGGNTSQIVYPVTTAQVASTTQVYSFAPGVTTETVTTGSTVYHVAPFNNGQLVCASGGAAITVGTLTTALQAGDQFSNIAILTQVQNDNN